jgi:regulator of replication initiation timing
LTYLTTYLTNNLTHLTNPFIAKGSITISMPSSVPNPSKSLVIQRWLQGEQRDRIADESGLSAGAVTNVVNKWKQEIGLANAVDLRELAVTLKKIGISPAQCATGFRVAMMINRLGVREDKFESFISDIYARCNKLGLAPDKIASFLTELLQFSENLSLSKLSEYIDSKAQEEKILNQKIDKLKEQKEDFEAQKSVAEELCEIALSNEKMTSANLRWYTDLRTELEKFRIPVNDVSQLAKVIDGIKQYGYDVQRVVTEFSDLQMLDVQFKSYREEITRLNQQLSGMRREYSSLQQTMNSWRLTIATCGELYRMGFGLKELRLLRDTITEIAVSNNILSDEATSRFFEDIDKHYDNMLTFESKLNKMRAEVGMLKQEEDRLRSQILTLQLVSPSWTRILQKGVSEEDIVDIAVLLREVSDSSGSSGKSGISSTDYRGVTIQEIRSLISELRKYGSIKSTLSQLNQRVDNLKNQVASLLAEKRDLATQNQEMLISLSQANVVADCFSGLSVSLKEEVGWLVSLIGSMICLINISVTQQKKLQDDEDFSVLRALFRYVKGEDVRLHELKIATAKAVEILLEKLDSHNDYEDNNAELRVKKILSETLVALTYNSSNK